MVKVALIHIDEEWRTGKTISLERLPARGDLVWTRAEERTSGTDMFVVECKATPMGEIELLIDSDTAVKLEDCAALNRAIEAELDREVEDYALMVASAGIGSELKLLRQYHKILGASVEVLLKDGMKILAKLDAADEAGIAISYEEKQLVEGKKRKQTVEVTKSYKWEEIKYVKEYLDFK